MGSELGSLSPSLGISSGGWRSHAGTGWEWLAGLMAEDSTPLAGVREGEPHVGGLADKLNWLRAGVLGANDGIVSVAGIVLGVAGATAARVAIFTAGLAGLIAGAVSMVLGEYVSVSSQRDTEKA